MLTPTENITIYHYDAETGEYSQTVYTASVYRASGTTVSGAAGEKSGGGFKYENECRLRIETSAAVDIGTDDYVYIGEGGELDKSVCLKVKAFADNRRGTLKHWRVDCE